MKTFKNGLLTGLIIQLAIGPAFFYVINLTLQKSVYDGLFAVMGIALADYIFIILAILGVSKLLENKKFQKIFGLISSLVLFIFGIMILKQVIFHGIVKSNDINSTNIISSFIFAFFLTISNPMTIIFNTGLFTAKVIEYNYTKRDLYMFGFSVGLAVILFMGTSVILFSLAKGIISDVLIKAMNIIVGLLLIYYGGLRFYKVSK